MPSPQYADLTANQVATVDLTDVVGALGATVKVTPATTSSSPVYFRGDGVTPAVKGAGCEVAGSGFAAWETARIARAHDPSTGADSTAVLKLVSAGAMTVKIEVVP